MTHIPGPKESSILSGQAAAMENMLINKIAPEIEKETDEASIGKIVKETVDAIHAEIMKTADPEFKEQRKLLHLAELIKELEDLHFKPNDPKYSLPEIDYRFYLFVTKYEKALKLINGMLRKKSFTLEPAIGNRIDEDAIYNPLFLFLACRLLNQFPNFKGMGHDCFTEGLVLELEENFLRYIEYYVNLKLFHHVGRSLPALKKYLGPFLLDLNTEKTLLELFNLYGGNEQSRELLKKIHEELKYKDNAEKMEAQEVSDDPSPLIIELHGNGKYREIIERRKQKPGVPISHEAGNCVIDANKKAAAFIKFDEMGMPYTNDPSPQYPWADLNQYRANFIEAEVPIHMTMVFAMMKKLDEKDKEGYAPYLKSRESSVARQLELMKRASVAELLRKLVNKDLNWGERRGLADTRIGYFTGNVEATALQDSENRFFGTNLPYPYAIYSQLNADYEATAIDAVKLFEPLTRMLEKEMLEFGEVLKGLFGDRFEILPSRVKQPESILLKELKEDKCTVGRVTDLIGFTIQTDTEDETERVYQTIERMMDPDKDIKGHNMWVKESSRGRKSMDITGVPKGRHVMIQVQCRPKSNVNIWRGRLANHEAYKVISGENLLEKIEDDPDKVLDLLYRAMHNLNYAYHVSTNENASTPERIMEIYSHDCRDGFSIIRTEKLY